LGKRSAPPPAHDVADNIPGKSTKKPRFTLWRTAAINGRLCYCRGLCGVAPGVVAAGFSSLSCCSEGSTGGVVAAPVGGTPGLPSIPLSPGKPPDSAGSIGSGAEASVTGVGVALAFCTSGMPPNGVATVLPSGVVAGGRGAAGGMAATASLGLIGLGVIIPVGFGMVPLGRPIIIFSASNNPTVASSCMKLYCNYTSSSYPLCLAMYTAFACACMAQTALQMVN